MYIFNKKLLKSLKINIYLFELVTVREAIKKDLKGRYKRKNVKNVRYQSAENGK